MQSQTQMQTVSETMAVWTKDRKVLIAVKIGSAYPTFVDLLSEPASKKFEGILGLLQFPTRMYKALRLDVLVLLQNLETIMHF